MEIDGSQHSTNPKQLESDLKRDYHSYKDGYVTKRFTNYQVKKDLNNIAEALVEVINKRIEENTEYKNLNKNKFQLINEEIDNL
ncbi:MAG: DUF559 domain-containing protein [Candidatus Lokiarchaeota archaeon]|nr:DUF559 domain-containing protein [Candidatus Lokiarchaeota archaeon]